MFALRASDGTSYVEFWISGSSECRVLRATHTRVKLIYKPIPREHMAQLMPAAASRVQLSSSMLTADGERTFILTFENEPTAHRAIEALRAIGARVIPTDPPATRPAVDSDTVRMSQDTAPLSQPALGYSQPSGQTAAPPALHAAAAPTRPLSSSQDQAPCPSPSPGPTQLSLSQPQQVQAMMPVMAMPMHAGPLMLPPAMFASHGMIPQAHPHAAMQYSRMMPTPSPPPSAPSVTQPMQLYTEPAAETELLDSQLQSQQQAAVMSQLQSMQQTLEELRKTSLGPPPTAAAPAAAQVPAPAPAQPRHVAELVEEAARIVSGSKALGPSKPRKPAGPDAAPKRSSSESHSKQRKDSHSKRASSAAPRKAGADNSSATQQSETLPEHDGSIVELHDDSEDEDTIERVQAALPRRDAKRVDSGSAPSTKAAAARKPQAAAAPHTAKKTTQPRSSVLVYSDNEEETITQAPAATSRAASITAPSPRRPPRNMASRLQAPATAGVKRLREDDLVVAAPAAAVEAAPDMTPAAVADTIRFIVTQLQYAGMGHEFMSTAPADMRERASVVMAALAGPLFDDVDEMEDMVFAMLDLLRVAAPKVEEPEETAASAAVAAHAARPADKLAAHSGPLPVRNGITIATTPETMEDA